MHAGKASQRRVHSCAAVLSAGTQIPLTSNARKFKVINQCLHSGIAMSSAGTQNSLLPPCKTYQSTQTAFSRLHSYIISRSADSSSPDLQDTSNHSKKAHAHSLSQSHTSLILHETSNHSKDAYTHSLSQSHGQQAHRSLFPALQSISKGPVEFVCIH